MHYSLKYLNNLTVHLTRPTYPDNAIDAIALDNIFTLAKLSEDAETNVYVYLGECPHSGVEVVWINYSILLANDRLYFAEYHTHFADIPAKDGVYVPTHTYTVVADAETEKARIDFDLRLRLFHKKS